MAHAHALREELKRSEKVKSEGNCLADTGMGMRGTLCLEREHKRLYDFVGMTFFSIAILKDLIVCWDA